MLPINLKRIVLFAARGIVGCVGIIGFVLLVYSQCKKRKQRPIIETLKKVDILVLEDSAAVFQKKGLRNYTLAISHMNRIINLLDEGRKYFLNPKSKILFDKEMNSKADILNFVSLCQKNIIQPNLNANTEKFYSRDRWLGFLAHYCLTRVFKAFEWIVNAYYAPPAHQPLNPELNAVSPVLSDIIVNPSATTTNSLPAAPPKAATEDVKSPELYFPDTFTSSLKNVIEDDKHEFDVFLTLSLNNTLLKKYFAYLLKDPKSDDFTRFMICAIGKSFDFYGSLVE